VGDHFAIAVFTDAFNLFNVGTIDDVYTISSNENKRYGLEEGIVDPRIIRIGAKIEW
jgi:hypothetical protein